MPADSTHPKMPWYRVGMMWLVLAGPAIVVVAGVATTVIAAGGADRAMKTETKATAQAPAVQVRNKGATP